MNFLMTVDVEDFSIPLNRCDHKTGRLVYRRGLPKLLSLFAKHDMIATFYFTGEMCEHIPESAELVKDHGHEIGCHGYSHAVEMGLDALRYEDQLSEISKAKRITEKIVGKIESFRAPALRINEDTVKVLEKTGFTSDSSVCSQRFDGPFTFGSRKKLNWLRAPRRPYFLSHESISKKGNSKILEIPISAFITPYIGTTMRISPSFIKILQRFIFFEAKRTDKPVVFLFHPNETLRIGNEIVATRRSKNPITHLFADKIRQRMKLKNLGDNSLSLLNDVIVDAKKFGFDFLGARQYARRHRNN